MERIAELVRRYRQVGLLSDTNLLLLYLVGRDDVGLISRHKRTQTFTADDFDALMKLTNQFARLVTTPNILTEVVNLACQCGKEEKGRILATASELLGDLAEHYVESSSAASEPGFGRLGLTDVGIGKLAPGRFLVLTDDLPLSAYLSTLRVDCINLNHLRPY
jgi:hypothetical protein